MLMLGTLSPTVNVAFDVYASDARNKRYLSVYSRGKSSASSNAAKNYVSIWVFAFSKIIVASMIAIFFSFSFN